MKSETKHKIKMVILNKSYIATIHSQSYSIQNAEHKWKIQ